MNDRPHIGHTYTTVLADVIARFHRMRGEQVYFLTGTDEHGQKVEKAAAARGITPKQLADEVVANYTELWKQMGMTHFRFIRTTDADHKAQVQQLFKRLLDKGDIYKATYKGLYSVSDEAYVTETQAKELQAQGLAHQLITLKEETYFFRLSAYQDRLLKLYEERPGFVQPDFRFNEVKRFVEGGLQDLSISRTSISWGIPVPGDEKHVIYVWFDALLNYLTGCPANSWPPDLQIVGKDILRFHAVYWPAFLMAAGMFQPETILAHGWWLMGDDKMSKSPRNTISPTALAEAISPVIGADVVRYTLMRAIAFGQDGDFAIADLLQRYSSEPRNPPRNPPHPVLPFPETVGEKGPLGPLEEKLLAEYPKSAKAAADAFDAINPTAALGHIWSILGLANDYVGRRRRTTPERLATIVATAVELLEAVSVMIWPVMPNVSAAMREQLGLPVLAGEVDRDQWPFAMPARAPGGKLSRGTPIFPRFEKEKEAELLARFSPPKEEAPPLPAAAEKAAATGPAAAPATQAPAAPAAPREPKVVIQYDDFARMDLRVGHVLSAERVKKKDKLLDLRVDVGDDAPRRIIAGIAKSYAPEEIVGKRVVVLCNLAPREVVKGLVSEGMLLAGGDGDVLKVATLDGELPPGATVK